MDKITITVRQKKILMIVGIVALTFAIFILMIYLPLRQELIKLKSQYYGIEAELENIKKFSSGEKSLEEMISLLKKKLEALDNTFPPKEELILRELAGAATRSGIELVSINPQRKRDINELEGIPVNVRGYTSKEMSIAVSLKTSYKTLGEFFKVLQEDFPVFIKVESIQMSKGRGKTDNILNVDMNLSTYLLCPSEK